MLCLNDAKHKMQTCVCQPDKHGIFNSATVRRHAFLQTVCWRARIGAVDQSQRVSLLLSEAVPHLFLRLTRLRKSVYSGN